MRRETEVSVAIAASPDTIFERITDHVDLSSWMGAVKSVELLEEGTPRNGVGAVRKIVFAPALLPSIVERVTAFDPAARTYSYTLTAGMVGLRDHLGTLTVEPDGEGCVLRWAIWFELNPWVWGLIAGVFVRSFSSRLQAGLDDLAAGYV
ncbi:MAG: hypothetical protein ACI9U2_000965 [Bradymonadia bacterium]|jgi:hypothetical protein